MKFLILGMGLFLASCAGSVPVSPKIFKKCTEACSNVDGLKKIDLFIVESSRITDTTCVCNQGHRFKLGAKDVSQNP